MVVDSYLVPAFVARRDLGLFLATINGGMNIGWSLSDSTHRETLDQVKARVSFTCTSKRAWFQVRERQARLGQRAGASVGSLAIQICWQARHLQACTRTRLMLTL